MKIEGVTQQVIEVDVTPALAREWLTRNTANRPVRQAYVEALARAFTRGEYVQTHQGIAFAATGELLDGQHRLSAIAMLPDESSFRMYVTLGLARGSVFKVLDRGEQRTPSDVLERDRREVECARLIAEIYLSCNSRELTPTRLEPICEYISEMHTDLVNFCRTQRRTWSSAAVRTAAIITMLGGGDVDYVKLVYRSLVVSEFDSMPPSAQSLYRAYAMGQVKASNKLDMICRCLKVFDPAKANVTKIQINDQHQTIAQVRELIGTAIFGERAAPERQERLALTQQQASHVRAPRHIRRRRFAGEDRV